MHRGKKKKARSGGPGFPGRMTWGSKNPKLKRREDIMGSKPIRFFPFENQVHDVFSTHEYSIY
jgi:hypothetical protein